MRHGEPGWELKTCGERWVEKAVFWLSCIGQKIIGVDRLREKEKEVLWVQLWKFQVF